MEMPIEHNHKLCKATKNVMVDRDSYQRLVGKLIYLSHINPNIAYVVGVMSQFMHNPKEVHLREAHRIIQYLKDTPWKCSFEDAMN